MKAIVRTAFGGPEVLAMQEVAIPSVAEGQVLVRIHAFGLNHAELYMRRGQWGEVAAVSGIECVGEVADDPSGRLRKGQRVIAAMGGMGRAINGSYAEYVALRAANVVPVNTSLAWERLAMLPESYGVAWSCLHQCLRIRPGERLLVRGASSSLGRAALDLAQQMGVQACGTTRTEAAADALRELGASVILAGANALAPEHAGRFDAVLDLVGNACLRDSLRLVAPGGRVCLAGFLGGLAPVAEFNPLADLPSTVQLSFFGSFNFGDAGHAMADIPYQAMCDAMADGLLRGRPARVFALEEVAAAHALMESGQAGGKLVVRTGA